MHGLHIFFLKLNDIVFVFFSCLNSPDVIMVYDGSNKSAPIIGHLCNTNTFVELVSTGSDIFVEFQSRSHFPGQGFKASYFFDSGPQPPSINDIDVPYSGQYGKYGIPLSLLLVY